MSSKGSAAIVIFAGVTIAAAMWLDLPPLGSSENHLAGNAILAITALIVLWYTTETALLRKEMAKQNKMLARPVVVLELSNPQAFLKNYGEGPAIDVRILKYVISVLDRPPANTDQMTFRISPIPFLPQADRRDLMVFKDFPNRIATVSDLSDLFQLGGGVRVLIGYRDIEGRQYVTCMEIESGLCKVPVFQELRGNRRR